MGDGSALKILQKNVKGEENWIIPNVGCESVRNPVVGVVFGSIRDWECIDAPKRVDKMISLN